MRERERERGRGRVFCAILSGIHGLCVLYPSVCLSVSRFLINTKVPTYFFLRTFVRPSALFLFLIFCREFEIIQWSWQVCLVLVGMVWSCVVWSGDISLNCFDLNWYDMRIFC